MTESNTIPSQWSICSLSDLADDVTYGYTAKSVKHGNGPRMLRITDIQNDSVDWMNVPSCVITPEEKPRYILADGDLVFARTGATVGKSYLIKGEIPESVFASYLIRVRCSAPEMAPYLALYFKSPLYWEQISDVSSGTGQPNVNGTKLKALKIPVAPVGEQKRIIEKLNILLGRIGTCMERLERVPILMKQFRRSVLMLAVSGKLTEDWRESVKQEFERETVKLSEICKSIADGDHQAPPRAETGIPFVTIAAMNDGKLQIESATRFVPQKYYEELKDNRKPSRDDVLFSVTGSIAIPALVTTDDPFVFQRHIALLKPNPTFVLSRYLFIQLGAEDIKEQAIAVATGTAQLTIPLNGLRNFRIELPPLVEQHEIIRRVDKLFGLADEIVSSVAKADRDFQRIPSSILSKAFRGELVPQDSSEEPAADLLARINKSTAEKPIERKKSLARR